MVEIKTMTRKQVKDLRKAGLDLVLLGEADKTKTIEALEWVLIMFIQNLLMMKNSLIAK